MTRITPFYVTEKNAAALLDMSAAEYRVHVEAGHLPRGHEIVPGALRWDAEALRSIGRGDAIEGMGGGRDLVKKYIWVHPSGRIYFRKKGMKLIRIDGPEGTEAFDRQYWEILTDKRFEAKTSWAALMDDYRTSDRWTRLKPCTRQDYDKVMDYLREKIGTRDVKALTRADVIGAQNCDTPKTPGILRRSAVLSVVRCRSPSQAVITLRNHG